MMMVTSLAFICTYTTCDMRLSHIIICTHYLCQFLALWELNNSHLLAFQVSANWQSWWASTLVRSVWEGPKTSLRAKSTSPIGPTSLRMRSALFHIIQIAHSYPPDYVPFLNRSSKNNKRRRRSWRRRRRGRRSSRTSKPTLFEFLYWPNVIHQLIIYTSRLLCWIS